MPEYLRRTLISAGLALVAVACAPFALLVLASPFGTECGDLLSCVTGAAGLGLYMGGVALVMGLPLVLCWGVPLYALAVRHRRNHWWVAVLIGVIPGALYGLRGYFWYFHVAYGFAVAMLTHVCFTHRPARAALTPG